LDMEMRRSNNLASAQYDALTREQRQSTSPPKQPRLVLEDTTIEAAQEVFRDSPDGLLCVCAMNSAAGSADWTNIPGTAARQRIVLFGCRYITAALIPMTVLRAAPA